MLCYVMLCSVMLCSVLPCMFCHASFCDAVLCYGLLCHGVLCYALFCPVMLCSVVFVEGAMRDTRDTRGLGTAGGLAAAVCRVVSCCVLSFSSRARGGTPGTLGDTRDNWGSGGRGMQGGGWPGGLFLKSADPRGVCDILCATRPSLTLLHLSMPVRPGTS